MKFVIALLTVTSLLSGCAVYTPGAAVIVDPGPPPASGGGFCPPGQAKKGNC